MKAFTLEPVPTSNNHCDFSAYRGIDCYDREHFNESCIRSDEDDRMVEIEISRLSPYLFDVHKARTNSDNCCVKVENSIAYEGAYVVSLLRDGQVYSMASFDGTIAYDCELSEYGYVVMQKDDAIFVWDTKGDESPYGFIWNGQELATIKGEVVNMSK